MSSRSSASDRAFLGASAIVFAVSTAVTIVGCASMPSMGDMPMPGGWAMSMAWMRMSGQTWLDAAAMFVGMWTVMMVAMMLPALVPMLWRYRRAVRNTGHKRLALLTAVVSSGYFAVWTLFGVVVYPLGVALTTLEMEEPTVSLAVPLAVGIVVLLAGALQFTRWKRRQLDCCRESPGRSRPMQADARTAWRHGLRLGLRCSACCAGPTAVLLVLGVMDLWVMAAVTAAITVERVLPAGERIARATGVVIVGTGSFLIVRAVGLA